MKDWSEMTAAELAEVAIGIDEAGVGYNKSTPLYLIACLARRVAALEAQAEPEKPA